MCISGCDFCDQNTFYRKIRIKKLSHELQLSSPLPQTGLEGEEFMHVDTLKLRFCKHLILSEIPSAIVLAERGRRYWSFFKKQLNFYLQVAANLYRYSYIHFCLCRRVDSGLD